MAELESLDIKFGAKKTDVPAPEGDTLVFVREKQEVFTPVSELNIDHAEQFLIADSAAPISITIPTNANVSYPVGAEIAILRKGTGTVSITAASGVTLNGTSAGSKAIGSQWGTAAIRQIATDVWIIAGDI